MPSEQARINSKFSLSSDSENPPEVAYNETLADRVREALADLPKVVEKKMFRGVTFMVNGKMCVSVGGDELMCRIDPEKHALVIEKDGCREMIHGGRTMKGFVFVDVESIKKKKDFDYWIALALDFNKKAKAAPKKISPQRRKGAGKAQRNK